VIKCALAAVRTGRKFAMSDGEAIRTGSNAAAEIECDRMLNKMDALTVTLRFSVEAVQPPNGS
jgi:hypothetical protein